MSTGLTNVLSPGKWEEKVWGQTRAWNTPINAIKKTMLVFELKTRRGTFCSLHRHKHRANHFQVINGVLRVVWLNGFDLDYADLMAGDTLTIDSGVLHQFQVLDSAQVMEVYTLDRPRGNLQMQDIERSTVGGRTDLELDTQIPRIFDSFGLPLEKGLSS